jgi:uncharacterized protein YbbC (DUF1343 family)
VTLTYLVIPSASEGSHYPIPELSKTKILNLGVFRSKQEKGMTSQQIRATWQDGLEKFGKIREKYLLYK